MDNSSLLSQKNSLTLIIAQHAGMPLMFEFAAQFALNGNVRVLDCGNRFNIYPLAEVIRKRTSHLAEVMSRIVLSRAFTCYQVTTLLEETDAHPVPTLVLDLLSTFLDESVSLQESSRLLQLGITHLERLSSVAPVVISVKPLLSLSADRQQLLDLLKEAAADTVLFEAQHPQPSAALPLWPGGIA
jgi:hypothetical protein